MDSKSIFDLTPEPGALFIDNLMVAGADRLLSTRYVHLVDVPSLRDARLASALVRHDIFNLAQLVESLVCHDVLYVNSEFIDIWNQNVDDTSLRTLREVVRPIHWPPEQRAEAERALAEVVPPLDVEDGSFMQLVSYASHCPYHTRDANSQLFLPRNERHSWGTPFYVVVGTAFYLMCSQALGIPYKPSLLRAQMLAHLFSGELRQRRFAASDIAMQLLEKSRAEVAEEYFEHLLELNLVELNVPCVLATVLREASAPSEVIPIAMEIRTSAEAKAFRRWTREFSRAVQQGDLAELGRFIKTIRDVVGAVNRFLGLAEDPGMEVIVGWGPASVSRVFGLPAILKRPIYFRRHLWFLHRMYTGLATIARFSDRAREVLLAQLPSWFPPVSLDPSGLQPRVPLF